MPTLELTDMTVATAKATAAGRTEIWDAAMPGFGLRVSKAGRKSWVLMYRADGRKRRLTLGTFPALSLTAARDAARLALLDVARGNDPAAERAATRGDRQQSFAALAEEYLDRHARRHKTTWRQDERLLTVEVLPGWGNQAADSITRQDVLRLIEAIADRGAPIQANRTLALVRKLFNWAVEKDLVGASPVINVKPPGAEAQRDRVLTDDEIGLLWRAWDTIAYPFGPWFKLLLATGQRREALAAMRWSDITPKDGVWTIPAERTRSGRPHAVPLSTLAAEILMSLPRGQSTLVFPSRDDPERPVSGHARARQTAITRSGVADWRLHDLRRTAAHAMTGLGIPTALVGDLLDLAQPTLMGIPTPPASAADLEARREAMEAWASALESQVST